METLARHIDRATESIAQVALWLAVAMVIGQFVIVVLRYVFSIGSVWAQESVLALHAILFTLGVAYGLKANRHVRLDLFQGSLSARGKAWVDLVGVSVFLLPVSVALAWFSGPYIAASWRVLEGSPEVSGLPIVFVLKSMIWVMAATMILQGIAIAIRCSQVLQGGPSPQDRQERRPDGD